MAKNPDPKKVVARLEKLRKVESIPPMPNQRLSQSRKSENGMIEKAPEVPGAGRGWGLNPNQCFGSTEKEKYIAILRDVFPNYTEAARLVGVSRSTVGQHLTIDKVFRERVQEVVDECVDKLESAMFHFGLTKAKNFMDRIALARAYRPERFERAQKVAVDVKHSGSWRMDDNEAAARLRAVSEAVDAEIVREQFRSGPEENPSAVGLPEPKPEA